MGRGKKLGRAGALQLKDRDTGRGEPRSGGFGLGGFPRRERKSGWRFGEGATRQLLERERGKGGGAGQLGLGPERGAGERNPFLSFF